MYYIAATTTAGISTPIFVIVYTYILIYDIDDLTQECQKRQFLSVKTLAEVPTPTITDLKSKRPVFIPSWSLHSFQQKHNRIRTTSLHTDNVRHSSCTKPRSYVNIVVAANRFVYSQTPSPSHSPAVVPGPRRSSALGNRDLSFPSVRRRKRLDGRRGNVGHNFHGRPTCATVATTFTTLTAGELLSSRSHSSLLPQKQ